MPKLEPKLRDMGDGTSVLEFLRREDALYQEIHCPEIVNSPTFLHGNNDKIYTVKQGYIQGHLVAPEFELYELPIEEDLSPQSIAVLSISDSLKEFISDMKSKITKTKMKENEVYFVKAGVMHQVRGKGIITAIVFPASIERFETGIENPNVGLLEYFQ